MSNTLQTLTYRFTLNAFKNGVQRILQGWATGENLARKLEISLSAGQEAYELPMEGITASMYVTTPTTKTLSINACEIDYENNKIIYEVLPSDISEAGIVNMQLKIFDSAKILVSPSFGLDVWESTISDSQAVLSPTYTALTEALAEASAYSQKAISQVYVDEDYTFVVEFADGTEYTSTAIKDVIDSLVNGGEIAEGWARGTQEGVPVEEGSPYYHDNASYWSGQAHGYSGMAENAKQYAYEYAGDANTAKVAAQGYSTSASGFADEANKWANGKVGETDVPSTAPQYHNNAKYWSEQSQALGNAEYLAAKSYAVGGTGTREGEDLDNAKYYKEICESIVGGDYPAEDVTYQNTVSGLTADNAQDALDELAGMINGLSADDVDYDNTTSGLTASDVQDAIDEVVSTISSLDGDDIAYDNTTSGLTATDVQDAVDELADEKQDETLATPLTIGGVSQTTVEGALGGLNAELIKRPETEKTIAPRQGATASRSFKIGEWIVDSEGYTGRVTTAVSSGAVWTQGTNYTRYTITNGLLKRVLLKTAVHDGVKTYAQMLNEFYSTFNSLSSDDKSRCAIVYKIDYDYVAHIQLFSSNTGIFSSMYGGGSSVTAHNFGIYPSASSCFFTKTTIDSNGLSVQAKSSEVATKDLELYLL